MRLLAYHFRKLGTDAGRVCTRVANSHRPNPLLKKHPDAVNLRPRLKASCCSTRIKKLLRDTGLIALATVAMPALATPGKVNRAGCHASNSVGAYCHAERAQGTGGSDGTQVARVIRIKRECKGRVNAGACEGYTR